MFIILGIMFVGILLSFTLVSRCSFQTLQWFYIFCVLGTVYLLCPLNPRMLAFILFTHQYYISMKALRVAFKPLCRVVLKCTPYCERGARQGIAGPWTPITQHKSVSLFNYIHAFPRPILLQPQPDFTSSSHARVSAQCVDIC